MHRRRRTLAFSLLGALATSALPWRAHAQAQSGRPVRLIAGFAAGGPADAIARSIGKALEDELKHPVVVENRTGAAGLVGLEALTNSPPDGYTIGLVANTTTTALHFQDKPLDIDNRLTPVGKFVATRVLLVVNPDKVPVQTLPEFVSFLRRHPGTSLTSAGHGGIGHLNLELFAMEQDLRILHVAYRGSAPAMHDVISGQVAGMVVDATTALPHIQSGKLRAICVVSTERTPNLPELATAVELGMKSLRADSSMGIALPPRTPQPIVDRMEAALKAAVHSASYIDAATKQGNARFFDGAAQFRSWLQQDFDRYGAVIKAANIKVQ